MQGFLNIKQSPDNRHMYSTPVSTEIHQKCLYYNMQINSTGKNSSFPGSDFIATVHVSKRAHGSHHFNYFNEFDPQQNN